MIVDLRIGIQSPVASVDQSSASFCLIRWLYFLPISHIYRRRKPHLIGGTKMTAQVNGSPAGVLLAVEKPTINILLYTDSRQFSESKAFIDYFGLGLMIERQKAHEPTFATLRTTVVNRSTASHADNKLDAVLASESFDEIWFFGFNQGNTSGEPQSELDANEVAALTNWMKGNAADGSEGGGVLMTGDHANPVPANLVANATGPCGEVLAGEGYVGLGRAIGHCVPRAGMLRSWQGPPTSNSSDSFSTLVGPGFQMDRTPQTLSLELVNEDGDPDPAGEPHPLFFYNENQFIEAFPDHAHEGAVITPDTLDSTWPTGANGQTRPHVVARSTDRRNQHVLNAVATYNGDLAGVGRIVADSTWHHYTNLNLRGFPHPAPEGSAADQIGQFYANLAVWLAPRHKRLQMGLAMSWRLAQYTLIQEPDSDTQTLANSIQYLQFNSMSRCEAHELTQVLLPKPYGVFTQNAAETHVDLQALRELYLANVIHLYHAAMREEQEQRGSQFNLAGTRMDIRSLRLLPEKAFSYALEEQADRLKRHLEAVRISGLQS
jgi:hypothetical protein